MQAQYDRKLELAVDNKVTEMKAELGHTALVQAQTIVERQMETARRDAQRAQEDAKKADAANLQAQRDLEDMTRKLTKAQQAEAEALKLKRELADKERELELTIERRVTESAAALRNQAKAEVAESFKLQLSQQELHAQELRSQIEELKRKSEEASQRTQGEVQELDLEATLRTAFPFDVIAEVAKGVNGADCTQLVRSHTGQDCGIILYESKRTKNWSPGWLPKLRTDMRAANANIAVLVTQAMPGDTEGFDSVDGVWVVQPKFVQPLAMALRETLVRVHAVAQAHDGMKDKAELVYAYMTGVQFRNRVEAIVEAFTTMNEDLQAEKRATLRVWAKREAQINRTIESTAGLFGDLQGISGKALPEIAGLALPGGAE
jgi:hypothetical protein